MAARSRVDLRRFLGGPEQRPRLVDFVHLQAPAARILRMTQTLEGIPGDLELRICAILGPGERDISGTGKASELVDVAAGLVLIDSVAQPDHGVHREIPPQLFLNFRAREMRI